MKLKKTEIRIFDVTALDDPSLFEKAYNTVDEERRKKVDSQRLEKDKRLSLGAGLLLLEALEEFGIKDATVSYNALGKPCLEGRDDLFLSLSHSGQYAVAAFWREEIGVDVQIVSEASERAMRGACSDAEYAHLMSLSEGERKEAFARLWTVKESFVKFKGSGFLLYPPKTLEVELGKTLSISTAVRQEGVVFEEYELSGYKLTVCREK